MERLLYKGKRPYRSDMRVKYCLICGKASDKMRYCQSCNDFIRKMQKRDPA